MDRLVYDRMRGLEYSHWWFAGRRAILSRLVGALPLPPQARLLEAGCGVGGNIDMLRRFGRVEGLEPDAPSRDYIQQRYGLSPADGRLPDGLPYAPASFDAVFALDVVEHVAEDASSVAALGRLVKPGGYLILTVPAYGWMWSAHDVAHHHHRRYSRAQLKALIAQSGLTLLKASYFNTLLFPLAAVVRLVKRCLRLTGEDDRLPPAPLNRLMRSLFSAEAHWLARGSLPFGLSIVAIAQRERV
jgi:SAM-dependent methyltransferase